MKEGKPLLLIDVDGVLNRYPLLRALPQVPEGSEVYRLHPTGWERTGLNVLLKEQDGNALLSLSEATQLVWCTSWQHDANDMISPRLGLPKLPVIDLSRPGRPLHGGIWKRDAVEEITEGLPFAWIDDDFEFNDFTWARRRSRSGVPTLLVPTEPHLGALPNHYKSIELWARRVIAGDYLKDGNE